MYKLHLILKYLRKRRIAWISLLAVMLCTAMVLVVISVMGGWLRMFRETNHALIGDLIVYRDHLDGFGHYQEMIDQIEKLPEVKAAAPKVHTYAVTNIDEQIGTGVDVAGIDLEKMGQINGFVKSLHLQPDVLNAKAAELKKRAADLRREADESVAQAKMTQDRSLAAKLVGDATIFQTNAQQCDADAAAMMEKAMNFPSWDKPMSPQTLLEGNGEKGKFDPDWPGIIVGSGVIGLRPDPNTGKIERPDAIYRAWINLSLLRFDPNGGIRLSADNVVSDSFWLIDDSRTGVYQIDQNAVYVPFKMLQKDLGMTAQSLIDANTGQPITLPARCNEILISLKDGYTPMGVKPQIEKIVRDIIKQDPTGVYQGNGIPMEDIVKTETWDEHQAEILSAVEHEKALLVILFAIISVVAVFLIFCIFYMIVVEKTRDIGIIKSVGATGGGVASIFLGYGLMIGLVGGGMGLLLGYLVIHYINQLHAWMGRAMGIKIWDARTYLFDTIPNKMEPRDVVVIVSVAVLSSVLGSVIPAIRAARMNPVEALRWE